MEFSKSVKSYFDCYNSIDVRVAAYKQDDKWIAAIPVIRFRKKSIEEVKENILNPEKLAYFELQETHNPNKEKYNCYFAYSDKFAHRYILILNQKIIIATIIKIQRDWQKTINK